ncbi:porin family protein [Taibaiella koreensis]|uniref:porin family protein n=1 Tax=Taibaiella koreensis TaxID=1268548 RepID=UPI0013C31826|nr:porin family protein [Taibaiella koreensis]
MKRKLLPGRFLYHLLPIVTCCAGLLRGNTARAQASDETPLFNGERTFLGGLVLGANVSQVDGDYLNGYHKFGLNAGAVAYVNFSSKIGASMELLFSQKGSHSVSTLESPYYGSYFAKYTIHLNYAEVPVVLHYYVTEKTHVGIGASYNLLISSREDYNDASFTTTVDSRLYPFARHTVDGLLSASRVLWRGLLVNVRFQYSLATIRKFSNIPQGLGFENQKNNMFTFRLMYLL